MRAAYYADDAVTLYHGDCREILTGECIADLLLTDPPYGLAKKWRGGTWAARDMYRDAERWDSATPSPATINLCRASASGAIIWGGNLFQLPTSRCWLAWAKSNSVPTMADFELAWTTLDAPSRQWRGPTNADGLRQHPTQKPLALMAWCLGFFPSARTIIDPFCGSGTTLRAAKDLGRKAIGIELDERYCEIAAKRMAQETLFGASA